MDVSIITLLFTNPLEDTGFSFNQPAPDRPPMHGRTGRTDHSAHSSHVTTHPEHEHNQIQKVGHDRETNQQNREALHQRHKYNHQWPSHSIDALIISLLSEEEEEQCLLATSKRISSPYTESPYNSNNQPHRCKDSSQTLQKLTLTSTVTQRVMKRAELNNNRSLFLGSGRA